MDEGLRDTDHIHAYGTLLQKGPMLLLNTIAILLQNATKVNYQMLQVILLQHATVLLENSAVITKSSSYYKIFWYS